MARDTDRDALARRLREAGRAAEAAEVARLRKPGPPLWAVNEVARREPEVLARFLDAARQLKRAHFGAPARQRAPRSDSARRSTS